MVDYNEIQFCEDHGHCICGNDCMSPEVGPVQDMPDKAVEAVARALRAHFAIENEGVEDYPLDEYDCCARAALEAAAPFIRAQALEDAADALDGDAENSLYFTRRRELAYPYSKPMLAEQWGELDGIEKAAQFIRARAAAERGKE